MKKNFIIKGSIFLAAILLIFLYTRSMKRGEYVNIIGLAEGTTYNITFEPVRREITRRDIDSILGDFDLSLSVYNEKSIISRFNRNDSLAVADEKFKAVFEKSFEVYNNTGGAFDITVAPVVNALGFGPDNSVSFDSTLIDSLAEFIGMEKVKLERNRLIKSDPNVKLDVNAIAQGYSVDLVCEFLESRSIKNYLVEIGGEVRTNGRNPLNETWRIGIDKPVEGNDVPGTEFQAIIRLDGRSLATSGNYRRFFEKDGVKYVHTINPATGYPVLSSLLSATVVARDCMSADAYATAFMVMGLEKSMDFLNENNFLEAYFIYSDAAGNFMVEMTEGMEKFIAE